MRLLLVGASGYASLYLNIILNDPSLLSMLEGIVEPFFSNCQFKEQIKSAKIPVYDTMEEFYSNHAADLAIICTPTFLHCEQSIVALANGSNVLCEKPLAPTVDEALKMLEAEKKYNRFIAIGFQWSYAKEIQELKQDILNEKLGAPISFKTAISWPRNKAYYKRGGGWGGKIHHNGKLLLDSIASNACAHYLHNMFFILGETMDTSTSISDFNAECYRANDIENFDTCSIKITTANNVKLYFAATHAAEKLLNPEFIYTFEKAKVYFSQNEGSQITAIFNDGSKKVYGNPFQNEFKKIWDCIEAVKNHTAPICTVKTALTHTKFIQDLYEKVSIQNFRDNYVCLNKEADAIYIDGLFTCFYNAYENEQLFSETNSEIFKNQ